jgi:hypothetical protein
MGKHFGVRELDKTAKEKARAAIQQFKREDRTDRLERDSLQLFLNITKELMRITSMLGLMGKEFDCLHDRIEEQERNLDQLEINIADELAEIKETIVLVDKKVEKDISSDCPVYGDVSYEDCRKCIAWEVCYVKS